MGMKKAHESIRVFKNPYLERLTHVHPITPLVLWVPVTGYLIWRSLALDGLSPAGVLSTVLGGLFFWTLAEYALHRYIFHFYGNSELTRRFQFLIHGLHHDDPVDPTRLVMPPAAAVILAVILYSGFRLVLGHSWVDPFFAGFVIGYLCYDYIHYGIHHFHPRSRLGKWVKKHHMLHHFATPEARWGVSSPLWDYVFGTLPSERPVRRTSATPRPAASEAVAPMTSLSKPDSAGRAREGREQTI